MRWSYLALLALAGCSSSRPCKTDLECGDLQVCAHPMVNGQPQAIGRCTSLCKGDGDCLIALQFGESCAALTTGPATVTLKSAHARTDAVATPLSGLRACLKPGESVR